MSEQTQKKSAPAPAAKPTGATAPPTPALAKDPEAAVPPVPVPVVPTMAPTPAPAQQTQITPYQPPKLPGRCRKPRKHEYLIMTLCRMPTLAPTDKDILHTRYVQLLREFDRRTRCYSVCFHTMRLIVTVGSLLVPALLSVQYSDNYKDSMYWITWVISLAVTMSNGIFTLLKVDKKYYYLHTTMELLYSEGWQFLSLTGKYSAGGNLLRNGEPHNHTSLFPAFCHYVEKIKLRQVEEEYYKGATESQTGHSPVSASGTGVVTNRNGASVQAATDGMNLITPLEKNLSELAASLPKEVYSQIVELLDGFKQAEPQRQNVPPK